MTSSNNIKPSVNAGPLWQGLHFKNPVSGWSQGSPLRFRFKALNYYWQLFRMRHVTDIRESFLFARDAMGGTIRPWQDAYEFMSLLQKVQQLKPKVVVEIGTMNGGTLFMYTRVAADDATLISIDLPHGIHGGGYPIHRSSLYRRFARPGQNIQLMRADSHLSATLDALKKALDGKAIDFLFIDGDHTYEGVRQDYEMYSPLVRSGGLVAFHDTAVDLVKERCEVNRFWAEVQENHEHEEFVQSGDPKFGIGVIVKK